MTDANQAQPTWLAKHGWLEAVQTANKNRRPHAQSLPLPGAHSSTESAAARAIVSYKSSAAETSIKQDPSKCI